MAHVGIDARLNYYRVGGISTYTRGMVTALEALSSPHRFTVFHSRRLHTPDFPARFDRAALWTPCHHRLERAALSLELARFRLDVLHSPDFIPPWRGAKRHVITVHDLAFLLYPQFMTPESHRYYNAQIQAAVRRADQILAVSEATRADLMRLLNVPADKITVQVEGVDSAFRPLPAAEVARARGALNLPERYLLFVGTLEPRKNIPGLLAGYRLLRAHLPDTPPLLLVGKRGWLFDDALLRDAPGVRWHDAIAHSDLPAVYSGALALVLPSHYEGFGLPALEAMACGCPPIVSSVSSLPEVVGDVGALVNPDDPEALAAALERAVLDEGWRAAAGTGGVQRARLFTWQRAAQTALDVYTRLL